MFKSFHLATALIRIPHLAFSLFVFPLVMSLALVIGQLIVTGVFLKAAARDSSEMSAISRQNEENNILRRVLYGDGKRRAPLTVCRWRYYPEFGREGPPDESCQPDRLDVALHVPDPTTFSTADYEVIFDGHIDKLHVCTTCRPDVVISIDASGRAVSTSNSLFGLGVLSLPYMSPRLTGQKVQFLRSVEQIQSLLGGLYLSVPEIPGGIGISELRTTLPITLNITLLVVIALWLALRAHRKVLDYFSHNDVLLPLVAACGKGNFYSAIWFLTALRVGCFLFASVPLVYFGLKDLSGDDVFSKLDVSALGICVWLVALISTLSLATIVASIAELKHRHNVLSFLYRYIPIFFAVGGAAVWASSFLFLNSFTTYSRAVLTVLPVVGMTPIFVAPVLNLPIYLMGVHILFSLTLLWFALRHNARWFAAHLEEV